MDSLNIILVIGILYILYMLTYQNNYSVTTTTGAKKEKFTPIRKHNRRRHTNKKLVDEIMDDIVTWDGSLDSRGIFRKESLNPNFLHIKFHNDYRDIMTAINNLIPDKKQLFNLANMPLTYSQPEINEVKNMVSDFIDVININLVTEVPTFRNKNSGWDEAVPDPNIKSGWDKLQESLGLSPSLWNQPAPKGKVRLIAIQAVEKYETEDEKKHSIDMVLGKEGVDDQLVMRASFVEDKRPLRDENNFFVTSTVDTKVAIEDIDILGYLSKGGNDSRLMFDQDMEKYYDYKEMEYNDLTDPKYIQKVLMTKYKERNNEMEMRTALLDEEGQAFHSTLPHIYDFSNIKGTQTIFDDFNYGKTFT